MTTDARLQAQLDRLWSELQDELTVDSLVGTEAAQAATGRSWPPRAGSGSRRSTSRRRRVAIGVGLSAVSLALAGGAAAQVVAHRGGNPPGYVRPDHARTGIFSTGRDALIAGPGEFFELNARDAPEAIKAATRDIPFPPGYEDFRRYTYTVYLHDDYQGRMSESAVRSEVAHQAICSWVDYWVVEDRDGDRVARKAATRALEGSLRWNAVTVPDPHPDPLGAVDANNGERMSTPFGYLPATIRAARRGDAEALARSLFVGGGSKCWGGGPFRALNVDRLLGGDAS